jgi:hypothetical protein
MVFSQFMAILICFNHWIQGLQGGQKPCQKKKHGSQRDQVFGLDFHCIDASLNPGSDIWHIFGGYNRLSSWWMSQDGGLDT